MSFIFDPNNKSKKAFRILHWDRDCVERINEYKLINHLCFSPNVGWDGGEASSIGDVDPNVVVDYFTLHIPRSIEISVDWLKNIRFVVRNLIIDIDEYKIGCLIPFNSMHTVKSVKIQKMNDLPLKCLENSQIEAIEINNLYGCKPHQEFSQLPMLKRFMLSGAGTTVSLDLSVSAKLNLLWTIGVPNLTKISLHDDVIDKNQVTLAISGPLKEVLQSMGLQKIKNISEFFSVKGKPFKSEEECRSFFPNALKIELWKYYAR